MMVAVAAVLAAAGCEGMSFQPAARTQQPVADRSAEEAPGNLEHLGKAVVRDGAHGETDAMDLAMDWMKKAAEANARIVEIQQQKADLKERNIKMAEQIAGLEKELKQTRGELSEANEMLLVLRKELDQWKSDVLGFRDEMRKAQSAELRALRQVLKILGAEVPEGGAQLTSTKGP